VRNSSNYANKRRGIPHTLNIPINKKRSYQI
jgi:hypothetical protein